MTKTRPARDEDREDRITMEVVVDAYGPDERALGWYYYLEGKLQFPFTATCVGKRAVSPLRLKDEVEVIGMPDEYECQREMFVTVRWEKDGLAVPLSQLMPTPSANEPTKQAVDDWHYWVRMGYRFG